MPDEPIITSQPAIEPSSPDAAELTVLKAAHKEMLFKRSKDKARITELESGAAELQNRLTEASDTIRDVTIGVPLRTMCESLSTVPDLFLEQFSKYYGLKMIEGTLTLLSKDDGKPVIDKDGKAVPFERQALTNLLITGDDSRAKGFRAITIASRASGAGGTPGGNRASAKKAQPPFQQFGLR